MTSSYLSMEELKESLTLSGSNYADADIARAIDGAATIVDSMTGRTFTDGPEEARWFTPVSSDYLIVDAYVSIVAVSVSGQEWVEDTGFYRNGGSYVLRSMGGYKFPRNRRAVEVTAHWGYTQVPAEVKAATSIIATQLLRRVREAPFGIISTSLEGPAIRLSRYDAQVDALLLEHTKSQMIE